MTDTVRKDNAMTDHHDPTDDDDEQRQGLTADEQRRADDRVLERLEAEIDQLRAEHRARDPYGAAAVEQQERDEDRRRQRAVLRGFSGEPCAASGCARFDTRDVAPGYRVTVPCGCEYPVYACADHEAQVRRDVGSRLMPATTEGWHR